MSSKQSALDMLMKKVSCAGERLSLIHKELQKAEDCSHFPTVELVTSMTKDLQNELSSALSEAQHAHMTEQPTSGETRSSSISKDTLEAIEVSALLLVQSMKMIVGNEVAMSNPESTQTKSEAEGGISEIHRNDDATCPICLRIANHPVGGLFCKSKRGGIQ